MDRREMKFTARREARGQAIGDRGLTDEDRQHIQSYADKLDAAIDLVREEIAAIGKGHLSAVSTMYVKKSELLKWLELRAPVVEPFLNEDIAKDAGLPTKLATFKSVLEEDSELLQRMAGVAASIAREIQKVMNRDSLDGLYGKSGQKLSNAEASKLRLDQKI